MISSLDLIDESDNLAPEPAKVKCSNVEAVQHDYATGRVIETLQQGRHCGLSYRVKHLSDDPILFECRTVTEWNVRNYLLQILQQWRLFYWAVVSNWTSARLDGLVLLDNWKHINRKQYIIHKTFFYVCAQL